MAGSPVWSAIRGCLCRNALPILQVAGVIGGISLGFILRAAKGSWTKREISYVQFGGELFMNMLKGLILPLIVSSMIASIGSLDLGLSKMIGGRGIAFYLTTTVLAIVLGITLSVSIQPGYHSEKGQQSIKVAEPSTVEDTLMDLVRTMFPPNLVQACLQRYRTKLTIPDWEFPEAKIPLQQYDMSGAWENGSNIIGLIVFSIALGIALSFMGPKGKPLLNFFLSLAAAMNMLTTWVIWISPIGILSLVATQVIKADNFGVIIRSLGLYFTTVTVGLLIHGVIFLPLIYFILTRKLPFRFASNMMPAITMALGTGSSIATLPVTMKCLEERNKIDPRVARFLLPIGATINMDGTALYEAVAAIFIAQLVGMSLPLGHIVAIAITATAASIGAAGIPQAGLVTMVMVLNTVGLPAEYISYIIPIDWLLDRFRTAVNVFGDSIGCGVVDHMCRKQLDKLPFVETDEEINGTAGGSLHSVNASASKSIGSTQEIVEPMDEETGDK